MRHHHQINDLKLMPSLSCLSQISNTNLSPQPFILRNYYDLLTKLLDLFSIHHIFFLFPFIHKKHGMSTFVKLMSIKINRCKEITFVEINNHKFFFLFMNIGGVNRMNVVKLQALKRTFGFSLGCEVRTVMDQCCFVINFEENLWFQFG